MTASPGVFLLVREMCQVIYTASTLVEQSTPSEHVIFDAYATVSGTLAQEKRGKNEQFFSRINKCMGRFGGGSPDYGWKVVPNDVCSH